MIKKIIIATATALLAIFLYNISEGGDCKAECFIGSKECHQCMLK